MRPNRQTGPRLAGGIGFANSIARTGQAFCHTRPRRWKETTHMKWKGLASAAAMAVLACGSVAFASDDTLQAAPSMDPQPVNPLLLDDTTTAPSTAPASAPASAPSETTLTPVMYLISNNAVGQWLSNNNFNITGWVEGGYYLNTNNPRMGTGPHGDDPTVDPGPIVAFPGDYSNRVLLDQLDMTLSRTVNTNNKFDWGFTVEFGYGTDYSYFHSHGLLDNRPPDDPQNQFDLTQANFDLFFNVGTGLTLTAGKFLAFLGEEVNSPTYSWGSSGPSGNPFYTHSYLFFDGIPDTNTGIYGTYTFNKLINGNNWTLKAGFSNGWNQSLRDNNSAIDFLGQFAGSVTSNLAIVTNLEWGPEGTGDDSDYWTTVEMIPTLTVSDQLTVAVDCLYSDAPHSALTTPGASAQWYAICGYAMYKINSMFGLAARAEWYRDQGGLTTGEQANYYELTLGTQIHPLPDDNIFQYLCIRPELRGDASDRRVYDQSGDNGAGEYSQLSFAVDVTMQF
jgi:hypothetical protein